ncbi:hypothetical protein PAE1548 [Pyrobaculum aerophilum str. IM2]|uniref:Uncharacterized protein n=2 Tax=Pyrobaculum aerophilum TaxID=13773 RepID=Q8ZWZ5_PYRAE|nr:hypothetical protein [Pyrobaculum aerophilum]AAL63554.1 hypothetical protein PAE1548 [Pyrobaculum aerophilum str. IM2]
MAVVQIIDYSMGVNTLGETSSVISPMCKCPPPAPRLSSYLHLARALMEIYGVNVLGALIDQADLGLTEVDAVLLFVQIPLEKSWAARLIPQGQGGAKCVAPFPDPVIAAISLMSTGVESVAVDLRFGYQKYAPIIVNYALLTGAEVQILTTRPADLPGEIIFHSSAPPFVREKYVKAVGDVSVTKGEVRLTPVSPSDDDCRAEPPDYTKALLRVVDVLGLDINLVEDLASQGVLSHGYVQDFASPWQIGYLVKWDLIRQAPGGWSATHKLLYLYGLYRGL